ncbi:hypothetical protein NCCP436_25110 [Pseudomonas sp. NCCP-436]|nr:hypothetical protein NCCP436_25110 [Pseudomonas sp. NCCP-436]
MLQLKRTEAAGSYATPKQGACGNHAAVANWQEVACTPYNARTLQLTFGWMRPRRRKRLF